MFTEGDCTGMDNEVTSCKKFQSPAREDAFPLGTLLTYENQVTVFLSLFLLFKLQKEPGNGNLGKLIIGNFICLYPVLKCTHMRISGKKVCMPF